MAAGAVVAAGAAVSAGAACASVGSGVAVAAPPQATTNAKAPTIAQRILNRKFLNHVATNIIPCLSGFRNILARKFFFGIRFTLTFLLNDCGILGCKHIGVKLYVEENGNIKGTDD